MNHQFTGARRHRLLKMHGTVCTDVCHVWSFQNPQELILFDAVGLMAIPDDKMHIFSNSTTRSQYERVPTEIGSGYRAMPDVLHQLHCLNTIRQFTWFQTGHYGPKSPHKLTVPHALQSSEVGNRMHADHCIETIRKVLMCHADVSPLLDIVDPQNPLGRKGDFNIRMKCRNFARLQDWLVENMKIPFAELTDDTA